MDNSQQKPNIRPKVVKAMIEDFKKNPPPLKKSLQSLIRGEGKHDGGFRSEAEKR